MIASSKVPISAALTDQVFDQEHLILMATRRLMENSGITSKSRSRAIIDASPVPMALNDDKQRITYLNPAFVHTFGYTLEDIPTLSDWWPKAYPDPEYRQWVANIWHTEIDRVKRSGDAFSSIELNVRCKNGENKTALISAASLADTFEGEHVVVLVDMTERKQAELELQKSESRFRLLFEGASDAIFLADAETGLLIDCNTAAENLLGRERAEIIGQPQTFLHPPDAADRNRETFHAHASLEVTTNIEAEVLRKDGRRVPVSVAPSVTTIGRQKVIQGIFRDITERRKVEEALKMMRFSVDHAGDSILWINREGQILYANDAACRDRHYTLGELVGMTIFDLDVEPDYQPEVWEVHFEDLRRRGTITLETLHRTKDGHTFPVEVCANYVHVGNEEFNFCSIRDITERKQLEQELRTSRQRLESLSRQLITTQEAERRHLARELHDEFGQMLTAMKMNLRAVQRSAHAISPAQLNETISTIDQATVQVRNLALNMRPPHLDTLGLVATLHWYLKSQAELAGFHEKLTVDPPEIQISSELATVCFRITQEAVTNAVRHAYPKEIEIELRKYDSELHLVIRDDGKGFDVTAARLRASKGSSLGLISMQERANLTGGQMEIESIPGQGTTIHARFPLLPD